MAVIGAVKLNDPIDLTVVTSILGTVMEEPVAYAEIAGKRLVRKEEDQRREAKESMRRESQKRERKKERKQKQTK